MKKTLNTVKDYKVVLVSPSTHIYWNLASIRGLLLLDTFDAISNAIRSHCPGSVGRQQGNKICPWPTQDSIYSIYSTHTNSSQVFQEIEPGFKQYSKDSFEFIHGTASGLDPETKTVIITTAAGETKQTYDVLVLATGTRTTGDLPWKASLKGYQATKDILDKYRDLVQSADSIVLGGGGPTGVEAAGEIGFEYGKTKDITLITAGPELCDDCLPVNISKVAEKELQKLHVKITKGVKITSSTLNAEGKTELTLSNGETKTVDLYLPTTGLLPNSEYIPKSLLDDKGYVIVDEFLRVKGIENAWAVGDVSNIDPSQFVYLQKQIPAMTKNLDLVLKGKQPVAYKSGGDRESPCSHIHPSSNHPPTSL